jgi:hypothetical protein
MVHLRENPMSKYFKWLLQPSYNPRRALAPLPIVNSAARALALTAC